MYESVAIECFAPDDELLFAEWLNALVYEMATRGMLFGRFAVQLNGAELDLPHRAADRHCRFWVIMLKSLNDYVSDQSSAAG